MQKNIFYNFLKMNIPKRLSVSDNFFGYCKQPPSHLLLQKNGRYEIQDIR